MSFSTFKELCRGKLMLVEEAIVETYRAELPATPFSAVDGGAHTGYHSVHLAALPACHKVIAIEADPFTVERLRTRLGREPEEIRSKIDVVHMAIQENPDLEEVRWMSSSSHPGRSGVSSIWQKDETVTFREDVVSAAATTIDKLTGNVPAPVKMIKLDLEGGDYMALRGAVETLRRDRPLVVLENSNRAPSIYGFTIADVLAFLDSVDYEAVTFAGDIATEETWFTFWETWVAPKDLAPSLAARLKTVTSAILARETA